ncbi:hypothetical protein [Streptomyces shenzhenensis]|uniref:hypothetical protein n=1 Tax=Streptomyces shenzhenensis TaxID=943815 RepID=UPI0033E0C779
MGKPPPSGNELVSAAAGAEVPASAGAQAPADASDGPSADPTTGPTDPGEPGTDPTTPPTTDPTDPPTTDPTDPPTTDPTDPGTDPSDPPTTDPTQPGGGEPSPGPIYDGSNKPSQQVGSGKGGSTAHGTPASDQLLSADTITSAGSLAHTGAGGDTQLAMAAAGLIAAGMATVGAVGYGKRRASRRADAS